MKFLSTFVLALLSFCAFSQSITWTTPITVYSTSGSNLHPRISLNRSGNPIILWGKTDSRAYFSRWNGTAFTAPTAVNGSLSVFAQSWAGPEMANFGDTIYVAMQVTPECVSSAHAYLAHSYDGGATFSAPVQVTNIDTSTSRFITVTTNSSGNPLVAFMKFNSTCGNAHYVVARSTDFGATFTSDVLASGASGMVCDCCPSTLLSSGSKAVILFRNNLSNIRDIYAGVSNDGGATFSSTMPVDNNNWAISSCPASGPDGFIISDTAYSVFMSGGSGVSICYLSRTSISTGGLVNNQIAGSVIGISQQNYPRIANSGLAATAVWKQNTIAGTALVYAFTDTISKGFSSVTNLAIGNSVMNADVAMAPGEVHVVWEDDNTNSVMYMKGTYTMPSAVQNIASKEMIEVFPNPAEEYFSISLSNTVKIASSCLIDVIGRHIELKPNYKNDKFTFSVKGLTKGIYYFNMTDDAGKNYFSKITVQ